MVKWSFCNLVSQFKNNVLGPKHKECRRRVIENVIPELQCMLIDDIKFLAKYLDRKILVMSVKLIFSGEHATCGTLHMLIGGNDYYSTTKLITFEDNYSMN